MIQLIVRVGGFEVYCTIHRVEVDGRGRSKTIIPGPCAFYYEALRS